MKGISLRNVYVLSNSGFLGDKNQCGGVVSALGRKLKSHPIKFNTIDCDEDKLSETKIQEFTENDIVIAAGAHGLQAIERIKTTLPLSHHPVTILTGHQFFPEFKKLETRYYPDIVGLPRATLDENEVKLLTKHSKFIPLIGVPHHVTEESVAQDLKEFKNPPDLSEKFPVGIILAGDAPDHKSNSKKFFTPDDARKRANFIVQDLKNSGFLTDKTVLIITNGPRTGQHNYSTQEELQPNPHKAKQTDEVSLAFLDQLSKLGISPKQIQFYNFDFVFPSAYKPLLDWVARHTSIIYIPAESTSMVTESEYVCRRGGKVIVYSISSENLSHTQNNQHWFNLGIIDLLDEKGIHHPTQVKPKFSEFTDAEMVANEIRGRILIPKLSSSPTLVSSGEQAAPDTSTEKNSFAKTFS